MRPPLLAAIVACSVTGATPLSAQLAIDQSQELVTTVFSSGGTWTSQTFVQETDNIAGMGARWQGNQNANGIETEAQIAYELWTMSPELSGAARLFQGVVAATAPALGSIWVDIFFDAIEISPGTSLWMGMREVSGAVIFNLAARGPDPDNPFEPRVGPYANGSIYLNRSTDITDPYDPRYSQGYDLAFRTFTDPAFAPSTVTPEPVSMALLGTGLAGIGAVRRRRRRQDAGLT